MLKSKKIRSAYIVADCVGLPSFRMPLIQVKSVADKVFKQMLITLGELCHCRERNCQSTQKKNLPL